MNGMATRRTSWFALHVARRISWKWAVMSSSHEIWLGYAWLEETLLANLTLIGQCPGGVLRAYAPPGTPTPFIICQYMGGADTTTMNAVRLKSSLLYQVKVVAPAGPLTATLASASELIETTIGRQPGDPQSPQPIVISSVTVGLVLACYREQPLILDTLENGEQWTAAGGLYRLEIQSL
jgi:hypothetical protein